MSLLWTQNGNKENIWRNGRITILSSRPYRINIEAIRGRNSYSDIAIDDLDFIEKSCDLVPVDAEPVNLITIPIISSTRSIRPVSDLDCTFEIDYCIWSQSKESTFNWTRAQGILGDEISGPLETDHTYQSANGWYLTVNTNRKRSNDIARIETSTIRNAKCMEFYYFFDANTKYKFNIYIKVNEQVGTPIWSRTNSNANYWRPARITVYSTDPYKVLMELTSLQNGNLDDRFGIDDIYFTDGECKDSSEVNGLCTFSFGQTCDYEFSPSLSTSDLFKWQLYYPVSTESNPLPIYDHTSEGTGSGFIYVISNGFSIGDIATMSSKVYPSIGDLDIPSRCLEFFYFMNQTDSINLNVKAKSPSLLNEYTIWSRNYDHGVYWWKSEINIKLQSNYYIIFEAEVGLKPENGVVALDDISIRNGPCSRFNSFLILSFSKIF